MVPPATDGQGVRAAGLQVGERRDGPLDLGGMVQPRPSGVQDQAELAGLRHSSTPIGGGSCMNGAQPLEAMASQCWGMGRRLIHQGTRTLSPAAGASSIAQ